MTAIDRAVAFTLDNWEALGVEAHGEILHLPATIKRRAKDGSLKEISVMLRNVSNAQRFQARRQSRELAARLKLDLDRDSDYLEELENYALLAYAIRDPKTFDQHVPNAEALLEQYDDQSLAEVWGRYNVWVEMLDPRFGELDAEQLWQTIARVAREKNPAPLVAMPGREQYTCIVLMAAEASLSPNRPSWLQPPGISASDSSPASTSPPS